MRRFAGTLALITLTLCSVAWAQQDVFITGISAYTVIGRGLPWGSGSGAVNNNFIFAPLNPNTQVCLYVTNNNPSSAQNLTISLLQPGDPQINTFQKVGSNSKASSTVQTMPISVGSLATVGIYFNVTAAALLTAQITGSSAAGGSPDTADIFAVQTTSGGCGIASGTPTPVQGPFVSGVSITPGQQLPVLIGGLNIASTLVDMFKTGNNHGFPLDQNATPPAGFGLTTTNAFGSLGCLNGGGETNCAVQATIGGTWGGPVSKNIAPSFIRTNMLETGSDTQSFTASATKSFFLQNSTTNPAASAIILHQFLQANASIDLAYKTLLLDCSAACELKVFKTTSQGTTCTALAPKSMNIFGGTRASANVNNGAEFACATPPTASDLLFDLSLSNVPQTIDLSGWINPHSSALAGMEVQVVAGITGVVSATLEYVELPQ